MRPYAWKIKELCRAKTPEGDKVWPFAEPMTRELIDRKILKAKKSGPGTRASTIITDDAVKECLENLPDFPIKESA